MVKSAPQYVETIIDLSEEEHEIVTAKAQTAGLDLQTYLRFRALTAGELPDPAAFLPLGRRIAAFVKDYEALIRAFADRPEAIEQAETLGMTFAQLLEDWHTDYGPR
jgi:hypothetical protein